jgi:hypothetical protein
MFSQIMERKLGKKFILVITYFNIFNIFYR